MFYVNGTNIKLTRGDSASLSVSLDGYEMQDGSNNARALLTNGRTYSYTFIKYTS